MIAAGTEKKGDIMGGNADMRNRGMLAAGLEAELRKNRMRLERLRNEYNRLPEGDIFIVNKGKQCSYYFYKDKKTRSLRKNDEMTGKLIRKRVLANTITALSIYCATLENADCQFRKALEKTGKGRAVKTLARIGELPDRDRYILSPGEYAWKYEDYPKNGYRREMLRYKTEKGIRVRSKSEKLIGDKLEKHGIVYRYEARLTIDGQDLYPDFMIMSRDGKIVVWEHFGLMDNSDYFFRACRKIEYYRRAGFTQHTNLICTYEEDVEDGAILDGIIERFELTI